MISFKQKGDFSKVERYLERLRNIVKSGVLDKYGAQGVAALSAATPSESGKTASSWYYEVEHDGAVDRIVFKNSNVNDGVNIALILQTGHGTGTGGYVVGRDYINPAIQPLFDQLADNMWREVTSL